MVTTATGKDAWRQVWRRKGAASVTEYDLPTLMTMNGYDVGAGAMTPDAFESVVDIVRAQLGLTAGMRVLDVGCGAGALLWCLRTEGLQLYGIGSSLTLLAHAKVAIPQATFALAEAVEIPFQADAAVCCSIFQYFPNYAYARRAIEGLLRAAPVALVMDVTDLALRRGAEAARRADGSKPVRRLYYPRSFFEPARVWANQTPGYANARSGSTPA